MQRFLVGKVGRKEIVVRGGDVALLRIQRVRQRVDRQEAVPLVAPVAGHRHEPRPVGPQRRDGHRLVADVSLAIRPHHVFRRDAAERARLDELFPRPRLIHPQACEIRRRAGFHPRRPQRVRLVMFGVLFQNRAMPGELQIDRDRRLPLHRNGVLDHAHVFPRAAVPVLVRIGGVRLVDVEVLGVRSEDREAPCAELVVADRHAGKHRLAAADDVPPGRDEMHPVAQRRRTLGPMRIVHHHRIAALRSGGRSPPSCCCRCPRSAGSARARTAPRRARRRRTAAAVGTRCRSRESIR